MIPDNLIKEFLFLSDPLQDAWNLDSHFECHASFARIRKLISGKFDKLKVGKFSPEKSQRSAVGCNYYIGILTQQFTNHRNAPGSMSDSPIERAD